MNSGQTCTLYFLVSSYLKPRGRVCHKNEVISIKQIHCVCLLLSRGARRKGEAESMEANVFVLTQEPVKCGRSTRAARRRFPGLRNTDRVTCSCTAAVTESGVHSPVFSLPVCCCLLFIPVSPLPRLLSSQASLPILFSPCYWNGEISQKKH